MSELTESEEEIVDWFQDNREIDRGDYGRYPDPLIRIQEEKEDEPYRYLYGIGDGSSGEIIVPVEFDDITIINNQLFFVRKGSPREGSWGVYSAEQDQLIVPIEYKGVRRLTDSAYAVEVEGKRGIYSTEESDLILQPEYSTISSLPHAEVLAMIKQDSEWGIFAIDTQEIILPTNYDLITDREVLGESYLEVTTSGRPGQVGVFDITARKVVLPTEFEWVGYHSRYDLFKIKIETEKDKFGLYDLDREEWILPPKYKRIRGTPGTNDCFKVKDQESNYGFFSLEAEEFILSHEQEVGEVEHLYGSLHRVASLMVDSTVPVFSTSTGQLEWVPSYF